MTMLTRFILSVAIICAILSSFLAWATVEVSAEVNGLQSTQTVSMSLFDSIGEPLPWFKWIRAGTVLTVIFCILGLVASFYTGSHPQGAMALLSFAALCGLLTVGVYVPKMNSENEDQKFYDARSGALITVDNNVYSAGFITMALATVFAMVGAYMTRPMNINYVSMSSY